MENLYEINRGSYQKYFVVAESYAEAEKLWRKEYDSSPKSIDFITSRHIIVSGFRKR